DLGMGTYGSVWRRFPYYVEDEEGSIKINAVDQISKVIDKLKTNPNDRRMIVSAWHPYWVDHCALPPCHCLFHFNVEELTLIERRLEFQRRHYVFTPQQIRDEGLIKKLLESKNIPTHRLNCLLYQRSCDLFLGVPFNITSYSLLTAMMAQCVNMLPGTFIHTYGDLHIYENHLPQVKEQLFRSYKHLPQLELNPDIKDLFKFQYEDIKLKNYDSHPAIKAEIAV
ncbi:MAG TPA: thymidylate synthase, partial [Bacteroidales bacterium]|nr:thymidylate synthase [Bacteroidales bacterium]